MYFSKVIAPVFLGPCALGTKAAHSGPRLGPQEPRPKTEATQAPSLGPGAQRAITLEKDLLFYLQNRAQNNNLSLPDQLRAQNIGGGVFMISSHFIKSDDFKALKLWGPLKHFPRLNSESRSR